MEKKEKKLKLINAKIKSWGQDDEWQEGTPGKGPLTGRYFPNLDMEFVSHHSRERRDQETIIVSVRIPTYLADDIAHIVQSNNLPFVDRSQFVRTAIFLLMNYYGVKWPNVGSKTRVESGLALIEFENYMKRKYDTYIKEFEKFMVNMDGMSDQRLDKFLRKQVEVINKVEDEKERERLKSKFSEIMADNGYNPIPYFGEEGEDEE